MTSAASNSTKAEWDAARIVGEDGSVVVPLVAGRQMSIRLTPNTVAQIEETYNGVDAFEVAFDSKPWHTIRAVLAMASGKPAEDIGDDLDPHHHGVYLAAIDAAWMWAHGAPIEVVRLLCTTRLIVGHEKLRAIHDAAAAALGHASKGDGGEADEADSGRPT